MLSNYTTQELKDADALKKSEEQTEQKKIIISNDAYAICEFLIELSRISSIK